MDRINLNIFSCKGLSNILWHFRGGYLLRRLKRIKWFKFLKFIAIDTFFNE